MLKATKLEDKGAPFWSESHVSLIAWGWDLSAAYPTLPRSVVWGQTELWGQAKVTDTDSAERVG